MSQLDSRANSVIFDYANLIIRGPINFQNLVTNYTWPREYRVEGGAYNYVAAATAAIPLTTQNILVNDFTIAPVINPTTYFTVDNNGRITTNTDCLISVRARITDPAGLSTSGAKYKFSMIFDPIAGSSYSLVDQVFYPPAAGPYENVIALDSGIMRVSNGDVFYIDFTGTTNETVVLEYSIKILK